ncbi:MAG: riboflavin synthase [Thermodesulfobacterium geofontis]|uniref:Riboflavin synthase n=1 Tax=Thermodesulfobacterium geofontis TaxID=1295609 RepID=A0A2N7Q5G8_9BACT|nr:MAG: riboflavin synthase [Thermodesulfobacterium geofontis]PMP93345.1 MAG: riboflavin synthase [Thermodesulfobacterium geofontis]HEM55855.1 riboflavin synthase [Thermodesulfobium narugense]
MFTGLVEGIGKIISLKPYGGGLIAEISASFSLKELAIGDSIAVDGVCLTVTEIKGSTFKTHISPETLNKTTFRYKNSGDFVNLERALRLGDRLGGHLVSGHVDGIGKIVSIIPIEDFWKLVIEIPSEFTPYLIKKGSIAIDGVSLTINDFRDNFLEFMLVPHTLKVTTLCLRKPGDFVNIEIDMIAKMVYKWISPYLESLEKTKRGLTLEFLKEHGFL